MQKSHTVALTSIEIKKMFMQVIQIELTIKIL